MRRALLPLCIALGACVPVAPELTAPTGIATRGAALAETDLPALKTFAARPGEAPAAANADIARDFLDLAFALESGRELPVLTRFETPVSVRVTGPAPATLRPDLARLLDRLRSEAGIDVALTDRPNAEITVEAVPRAEIRRHLPEAACFVVPNAASFDAYTRNRRSPRMSWSGLRARDKVAVFVPADSPPQEVRDCLHEELAQALGPLNDLYRLPDSVFNDDNVHTVLTGYDMLLLRAYYDPALASGMTRAEVAAKLPAILARLNPAGEDRPRAPRDATPRAWIEAVQSALGPGRTPPARRDAASRALDIARAGGWSDHRLGFSHYAMGRVLQIEDPGAARRHFLDADRIFAASPRTRIHRAYVAAQLGALAVARGRPEEALERVIPHLDVAARHENAALLSTLMLLRAEALELSGRPGEARAARLDSLGWARYGFGADWAVRAKLREVSALNPLKGGVGRS